MKTFIKSITSPGATGNVAYTGIGFTPKAILFVGGAETESTGEADARLAVGATDGTNDVAASGVSDDNAATSAVGTARANTTCINLRSSAGTLTHSASIVSLDSDGFTLNWATAGATTRVWEAICIGGDDVQAAVGQMSAGAATGNRSVTGLSFQPNALIFFDCRLNATATGSGTYWRPQMGFVDSAGNQGSWCGDSWDAEAVAVTDYFQSETACIVTSISSTGTDAGRRAEFVSYNSDGFTVNFTKLDATYGVNSHTQYLALKVPYSLSGTTDQRTSNGTTAVATAGFLPKLMLVGGAAATDTNGGAAQHRFSLGAAVSAASQIYHAHMDDDGDDPMDSSSALNTGKALRWITSNGATPTTLIEADVSAVAKGSFTLNYTTTDATVRKVFYLALGDSGFTPRMGFIHHNNPAIA